MPQVAAAFCPWCHAFLDAATVITDDENAIPVGGDVSICLYCARVSIYEDDLSLRKPTPKERETLDKDDGISKAISVVKVHGPRDPGRRRET